MINPKQVLNFNFHLDYQLLLATAGLLTIGYIMVVSSTLHLGEKTMGNINHYPVRQLIHIVLGLIAAMVMSAIPLKIWENSGQWLFIAGLGLLILVLLPGMGVKVNGSVRWLSLGGLRIQVSEIVKLISVIYMAGYVTRHQEDVQSSAYGLVKPLLLFSIACVLLLLEPDFGSVVVLLTIAMGIMFLGGAQLWQFVVLVFALVILAGLLVYLEPYRMARVTSFTNPWADPQDSGFQLVQALIAFGRGEWLGVGLGSGLQKLFYLPEAHTDFLFSVIAEELGLLGVITVITLFSLVIWRAFAIAKMAEQADYKFAAYIAYGLAVWVGFQAFVNMGVNMGMLPTKGLTLPLMSYGGGSMITMCSAFALLFRVYSETVELNAATPKGAQRWLNG